MLTKSEITTLTVEAISSRKNCNGIVDVINVLGETKDVEILLTAIDGIHEFFLKLIRNDELNSKMAAKRKDLETVDQYKAWAKTTLLDFIDHIMDLLLCHDSSEVKCECITVTMNIVLQLFEGSVSAKTKQLPESILHRLLSFMISTGSYQTNRDTFENYWQLDDMRYCVLKFIPKYFKEIEKEPPSTYSKILQGIFVVLQSISENMPSAETNEKIADDIADDKDTNCRSSKLPLKEQQKVLETAWLSFFNQKLSRRLYKSVLLILHKIVIPNFSSPCLLTDFLTRSFNLEGGIALLALNGLFVLMTEHNLEYPNFYMRLYSTIHPRIFEAKYKERYFQLLNLFLCSSHIPSYLVAAFAKKLARLTLFVPPHAIQLLVPFIYNLLDNHPSIQFLLNKKVKGKEDKMKNDPYCASQADPALCEAMKSSLWELECLKFHYSPPVVYTATKRVAESADMSELSYEQMFDVLTSKQIEESPMEHRSAGQLFDKTNDHVTDFWVINQ